MKSPRFHERTAHRDERPLGGHASLILGLFVALLAIALATTPSLSAERFELHGDHVAIYDLAGEVTLEPGAGSAVVVHVERGGSDGGRLDVRTGPIGDLQTLRVIYPARRIHYSSGRGWGSSSTVHVGRDGRFGDEGRNGNAGRERVTISSRPGGFDAHADLRIEVPKGQKLSVYLAVGAATASNTEGTLRLDGGAVAVTTRSTRGELVIDVGSGGVEVNGAEGEVSIDTGSGGVDVMKVSGDRLLVDTGSGHVSAADVDVRRLSVDTGSGGVDLGMVRAREILVDTGSGGVDLDVASDLESLGVDTGSGSVRVRLPQTVGATVSIETGSGGIRSDFPIEVTQKDRDSLHGRIGDGHGRIVIETGSGTVRLLRR